MSTSLSELPESLDAAVAAASGRTDSPAPKETKGNTPVVTVKKDECQIDCYANPRSDKDRKKHFDYRFTFSRHYMRGQKMTTGYAFRFEHLSVLKTLITEASQKLVAYELDRKQRMTEASASEAADTEDADVTEE